MIEYDFYGNQTITFASAEDLEGFYSVCHWWLSKINELHEQMHVEYVESNYVQIVPYAPPMRGITRFDGRIFAPPSFTPSAHIGPQNQTTRGVLRLILYYTNSSAFRYHVLFTNPFGDDTRSFLNLTVQNHFQGAELWFTPTRRGDLFSVRISSTMGSFSGSGSNIDAWLEYLPW